MKIDNFLKALVANPASLQEKDKDFQKFFYDDITSGLFKRFSRERSRDEKVRLISFLIFISFINPQFDKCSTWTYSRAYLSR